MPPDLIFKICSFITMAGWIILVLISPFWKKADKFLIGVIITILCIVYAWLIATVLRPSDFSSFGSLEGVMELFRNPTLVTAGWIHYLALDLFVGMWIAKNGASHGINHWYLAPVLLITFMLAPVGLLIYLLIRYVKTKKVYVL